MEGLIDVSARWMIRAMAAAALMAPIVSAQAQDFMERSHKQQGPQPEVKPKVDEKAYKAALEKIPVPDKKYDPWGGRVRRIKRRRLRNRTRRRRIRSPARANRYNRGSRKISCCHILRRSAKLPIFRATAYCLLPFSKIRISIDSKTTRRRTESSKSAGNVRPVLLRCQRTHGE